MINRSSYFEGGHGQIFTVQAANPAAGANFLVSFDTDTIIKILSVNFTVVADANAANRVPLVFASAGAVFWSQAMGPVLPTANDTLRFSFIPGGTTVDHATAEGFVQGALAHPFIIPLGGFLNISLINIQVGDQISLISYAYEELQI